MTLENESFQVLLRTLDPEQSKAAAEYQRLHRRLVNFFSLQPVTDPYGLADEALDRLANRLSASPDEIQSPSTFLFGIARHLVQEEERRIRRENIAATELISQSNIPSNDEEQLQQLESCLSRMDREKRNLLLAYYRSEGREKIEHHQQMAEKLGISINTLRNRLMRARRDLDRCVRGTARDVLGRRSTRDE